MWYKIVVLKIKPESKNADTHMIYVTSSCRKSLRFAHFSLYGLEKNRNVHN